MVENARSLEDNSRFSSGRGSMGRPDAEQDEAYVQKPDLFVPKVESVR